MTRDQMTPEQAEIYDRAPWKLQVAVNDASPEIGSRALEAWNVANPKPFRPRPKVNPPTTPDRTTVDPHSDRRLPPERDEDDGRFGPSR